MSMRISNQPVLRSFFSPLIVEIESSIHAINNEILELKEYVLFNNIGTQSYRTNARDREKRRALAKEALAQWGS